MLSLLLIGMLTLAFDIQPAKAEPTTWTVDDDGPADFHTIQEAINSPDVKTADMIFVYNGTYYENVVVNKTVSLVGENKSTTVIDGSETGFTVNILANKTVINGFTIQNGWNGIFFGFYPWHPIFLSGSNISYNKIRNCGGGIWGRDIYDSSIVNNSISKCSYGIICYGGNLTVSYNKVANCTEGGIVISGNSKAIGNIILNNGQGLYLEGANNLLRNNTMENNEFNFGHISPYLGWVVNIDFFNNDIDTSNTINGKPIYYWISEHDKEVPSDAAYVELVNCSNIVVNNLNLPNNGISLLLANSKNCLIENLTITHNDYWGIALSCGSSNNTVRDNFISTYVAFGIELGGVSSFMTENNRVSDNYLTECGTGIRLIGNYTYNNIFRNAIIENRFGIGMRWGAYNNIYSNNILKNRNGILLSDSSTNTIFHNNFINNTQQVYSKNSINMWDNGYPSGGNYWSDHVKDDDYSGINQDEHGSDGIVDEPYVINYDNRDRYPLVNPWTPVITANIDIDPDALNLKSNGKWITAYIELPEGYSVNDIDVNTILINDTIPVDVEAPITVGDYDLDNIPDLMVKFDRVTITEWLGTNDYNEDTGKYYEINLTITGTVLGTQFIGTDKIKVLKR